MEELSIPYFRNLLLSNTDDLKNKCTTWSNISSTESDLPEEVSDEIRTTVGLTNLLLDQKLKQFKGLIDDSENNTGEKEITCVDLQGFWDMVYCEVEKIQKRFDNLEKCQNNDWVFVEETVKQTEPKKKPLTMKQAATSVAAKSQSIAARQRLAEHKLKMRAQLMKQKKEAAAMSNEETVPKDTASEESSKEAEEKIASVEMEIPVESEVPKRKSTKNVGKQTNVKKQKPSATKVESDEAVPEDKVVESEDIVKATEDQPVPEQDAATVEMEIPVESEAKVKSKGKGVKRAGKQKAVSKQKSVASKLVNEDVTVDQKDTESAGIAEEESAKTAEQSPMKKRKTEIESESVDVIEKKSAKSTGKTRPGRNLKTAPAKNEMKEKTPEPKDSEPADIAEDKSAKKTAKAKSAKPTLKNIENLHFAEESKPETRPAHKATSKRKNDEMKTEQKENILLSIEKKQTAVSKRTKKIPDDFLPLQCITRSAARKAAQTK